MRLLICLLATWLLIGSTSLAAGEYVDGTGTKVAHGLDAVRIVSLAPGATEMLFYLGLQDRVVGRSSFCNYPPEALRLPAVGGFVDTSLEKIMVLRPDLVVAYQGNNLELIAQLRQLKVAVVAFPEAKTLAEIGDQMEQLGRIAYKPDPPMGVPEVVILNRVQAWRTRLNELVVADSSKRPTVFYGLPGEITYSAAPGSFIDDLITRAGGRNVMPKGKERWPQVGAEFIFAAQPDWLLVSTPCIGHTELATANEDIRAQLSKDPVWSRLAAVKSNQIVVINADVLMRPGPRILDALEQLRTALGGAAK